MRRNERNFPRVAQAFRMMGRVWMKRLRSDKLLTGLPYLRLVDMLMALMTVICFRIPSVNLDGHHLLRTLLRCSGFRVR